MTIYYAIVDGDPISSGGRVHVFDHAELSEDPQGRMRAIAFLGDKAFCEACNSMGVIVGHSGIRDSLRMTSYVRGGLLQAVGGDAVLCRCSPAPTLIPKYALNDRFDDRMDAGEWDDALECESSAGCDQRFTLTGEGGAPCRNVRYQVTRSRSAPP